MLFKYAKTNTDIFDFVDIIFLTPPAENRQNRLQVSALTEELSILGQQKQSSSHPSQLFDGIQHDNFDTFDDDATANFEIFENGSDIIILNLGNLKIKCNGIHRLYINLFFMTILQIFRYPEAKRYLLSLFWEYKLNFYCLAKVL